ncbi:MAG TPA: hypothetical protein VFR37_25855 [Longimicrobium sp.]|nr:hypothetical protein [Longimicrobium sp.]
MKMVELLTVQDRFDLSSAGLTVVPDFSVPSGRWSDIVTEVTVIRPDQTSISASGRFGRWHFNIPDPSVPLDKRWRVVLSIPGVTKDDVPVGSVVLVPEEVADEILHGNAA